MAKFTRKKKQHQYKKKKHLELLSALGRYVRHKVKRIYKKVMKNEPKKLLKYQIC